MKIEIIPFNDKYLNDIRAINVSVSSNPDKPYKEKSFHSTFILTIIQSFPKKIVL